MFPPEKGSINEDLSTPMTPPTGKQKLLLLLNKFKPDPVQFLMLSTIIYIEIGLCQEFVFILLFFTYEWFSLILYSVFILLPVIGVIGAIKRVKVLCIIWAVLLAIVVFFAILYVPLSFLYIIFDGLDYAYLFASSFYILFLYAMAFYSTILMIKDISNRQHLIENSSLLSGDSDAGPANVTTGNIRKFIPDAVQLQVIFTAGIVLTVYFSDVILDLFNCCGNFYFWVAFISFGFLFVAGIIGVVGAFLRSKVFCGVYLVMVVVLYTVTTLNSWLSAATDGSVYFSNMIYATYIFFFNTLIFIALIALGVLLLVRHEKAVTLIKAAKNLETPLY